MERIIGGTLGRLAVSALVAGALAFAPAAALAEEAPAEEAPAEATEAAPGAESEALAEDASQAQAIDYASMSDEELQQLIDAANAELAARGAAGATEGETTTEVAPEAEATEAVPEATKPLTAATAVKHTAATVRQSTDKHVQYVKDYVGKNVASIGYSSLGGDFRDKYGGGNVELILVTADGSYVDHEDEDALKNYVVTGQSVAPDTEFHLTFMTDSDGEEYDNLVSSQTLDQIVLSIAPVGSTDPAPVLTAINVAPDKYTQYIRDYVGRNLAYCGYTSLGGNRMDEYTDAYVELYIVTEDGSYVDISDAEALKNYVVTGQDVAPNTEFYCTFATDSEGNEYSWTDYQSIEGVTLYVRALRA